MRRKTRRRRTRRGTRKRLLAGGGFVPIQKKPIVVMFFHGGINVHEQCSSKGIYTLKTNNQLMLVSHPGETGFVSVKNIAPFLTNSWFRQRTFEPLFDIHSISDLSEENADYRYAGSGEYIGPFTNSGLSLFESPVRAKEGSRVPNSVLHIGVPGEALESLFGIYIFSTDSEQLVKRHSFEEIRSSLHLPPGQRFVLLSDVFDFLERGGLYNPAVGLGVVQISCNTFYSMKNGEKRIITPFNIWADKNTVQSCIALENMYHIADAEYRALDLLDAREFDRKYPIFGAVLPVFVRESRRTGKNEGEAQGAMMDLVE